jgi:hypothetical protein
MPLLTEFFNDPVVRHVLNTRETALQLDDFTKTVDEAMLKFLLQQPFGRFSNDAVKFCCETGRYALLKILLQHRRYTGIPCSLIVFTIKTGRIDAYRLFARYGYISPEVLKYAAHVLPSALFRFMFRASFLV